MVRIIIKGGVWKNTEDEILKAAISKYGKNQWARISSLLVRKTPKQCKARWYEWLDPSIKKTEWSKEEDEKLLHLAKLMPTQWRTIAPIVGRTATQCLERYQKLLDEAESRDNNAASGSGLGLSGPGGGESAPSAEEVRRLRPGEIDPDPETKPARPDPIDMDEDEKEMLSEARARLANTQGKKAKRKARERSLEEARRLAMLQKRRELKAAGIVMRGPKKQKGMDYNADIPFEKQPARGFYDTSEESTRSYQAPVGKTITALNGGKKARDEAMNEGGKEKKRKGGDGGGEKDPFKDSGKEDQIRKLREAEQISKRRKLDLPAAQVGESELEEIVKMGRAGQISREMVSGDGNQSTEGLLGEYEALERAKHARTPMIAPEDDAIMLEARNLRNRTEAQTPLLGDANAPIHQGTGNAGALPRGGGGGGIVQTPNPLLTPARSGRMGDPGATPMSVRGFGGASNISSATPRSEVGGTGIGQTPMRTPFRDNLGLNEETSTIGDTPASAMTSSTRSEKYLRANARRELQMGLKGLPAPKNDFELVMDEDEEKTTGQDVLEDEIHFGVPLSEEDAAERDARIERLKEERRLKELARRSQAVQLGLPRPANVDEKALIDALRSIPLGSDSSIDAKAQRLIDEEMVRLLKHDSIVHPIAGSKAPGGSRSDLATLPDEYVEEAKNLIHVELATLLGFPGANPSTVKRLTISKLLEENDGGNLEAFEKVLSLQRENLAWHPDSRVWVSKDQLSKKDLIRGKQCQLEDLRESMSLKSLQATKEEKKLTKILGGYQARGSSLGNGLKQNFNDLIQSNFDHQVFERLFLGEQIAIPERIESLDKEVKGLNRIFDEAQNRWKEFEERQRELEEECEELQREIDMREAEKLNDEALEDQQDVEVNGNGKEGQDEDEDDDDDEVGPPPP